MLFWIIQTTVISVILIFLVHYLIEFFKSTLTIPKIKDLVNAPTQKYANMFNVISNSNSNSNSTSIQTPSSNGYSIDDLIPKQNNDMKSELKMFLKKQLNSSSNLTTEISSLDSMTSNTYSSYN
jgi:hypothetical protein